jgi:hypothetical protein
MTPLKLLKLGGVILAGFFVFWLGTVTLRAIWMERPNPPATVPVANVSVSDVEETLPSFTGYYLEFPEGTEDWRVTYASRLVQDYAGPDARYTVLDVTFWCLADDVWGSCNPVIRPVSFSDR